MQTNWLLVGIPVVLVILFLSGVRIIRPTHRGLVERLGKYHRFARPGFNWMLTLFDRPGAEFYQAYGPLDPGHEERLLIYRLWPALVHLRLFGGGYRSLVEQHLSAAGV